MADIINITRRTALKALPFAIPAMACPPVAAASPLTDQALLELSEKFESAFAAEEILRLAANAADSDGAWDAWEAASATTRELVDEIERMPATTLEGLRVKARCIRWCSGDGSVDTCKGHTADDRFARQIIMSLLEA